MEKKRDKRRQWIKFGVVTALYLLFLLWVKSWWGLVVVPFIYDVYITKKIRWQWWREAEPPVRFLMSWVDAIVFALVAVYFINLFFFQNYVIPSSSLEKSLLTGDYLFVSKVSYGPRIPQTPLTMPLTQHTLPVVECKSYIEWPQWNYRRVKGLGKVQLNDIVVFNYPSGDTLCSAPQYQAMDFYGMCYGLGYQIVGGAANPDSLDAAFIHSRVYNRLSRLPGWDETQRAYYMELLSVPPFPRFSHPAEERIDLRRNIISPQDPQRAIESAETRDFEPAARDRLRSRILESITCSSARCSLRTARPSSKRSASISTCKTAMILIGSRVCST